jgi:hypothetical protein
LLAQIELGHDKLYRASFRQPGYAPKSTAALVLLNACLERLVSRLEKTIPVQIQLS